MAKGGDRYVCQSCGSVSTQWSGRCQACGEWNALVQEEGAGSIPKGLGKAKGRTIEYFRLNEAEGQEEPRIATGISELDLVCGGGFVPGSAILIGGDPGIGKSTLLLQAVARLANKGARCSYISGEEAVRQIQMRGQRLGFDTAPVDLAAATSVRDIIATLDTAEPPQVVVIDSIQTMFLDNVESAPGTVTQVRSSAQELIRIAKARDICLLLVGHVTKEGQIAGPRVLEHMVDTVLYFEGERGHQFRILRAVKNRFGPANEIGVFEMSDAGLIEVTNPSALFLADRSENVAGSAVFAGIEGTRPVLVEIQALVAPSPLATPRRTVVGWDGNRLAMVMAVLDAHCGLGMAGHDVFLNIAGGLRIVEPAADLAVAAALVSSISDVPVAESTVLFGEISLSGEVRAVSQADARLREASKLGFEKALTPPWRNKKAAVLTITEIKQLQDLVEHFTSQSK